MYQRFIGGGVYISYVFSPLFIMFVKFIRNDNYIFLAGDLFHRLFFHILLPIENRVKFRILLGHLKSNGVRLGNQALLFPDRFGREQ